MKLHQIQSRHLYPLVPKETSLCGEVAGSPDTAVQGTAARSQGTYQFTAEGMEEGEVLAGSRGSVRIFSSVEGPQTLKPRLSAAKHPHSDLLWLDPQQASSLHTLEATGEAG